MLSALKSLIGKTGGAADERRQSPRVAVPPECQIRIGTKSYPLRNWSTSGFIAGPYDGDLGVKQRFKLTVAVRQDHFNIEFDAEAVVVRIDASGLAARFVFLPPAQKRQIEAYFAFYHGARR
jgi:hypothetical protein